MIPGISAEKFQLAATAAVILVQLLIVVPLQLYAANNGEFSSGFLNLELQLLIPAAPAILMLCIPAALLPDTWQRRIGTFLIALCLCLYLQSEILLRHLGPFSGKAIDWKAVSPPMWIDYGIWAGVMMAAACNSRKITKHLLPVTLVVFLAQFGNVLYTASSFPGKWWTSRSIPEKTLFEFSKEKNALIIILDTFASPAFSRIIEKDDSYAQVFDGFTYFRNTLGVFPTTLPSIPALLTGHVYDNKEPVDSFLDRVLRQDSLPAVLKAQGWQTDVVTYPHFCPHMSGVVNCLSQDAAARQNPVKTEKIEAARLFDITLFRSVPGMLKRWIHNGEKWRVQQYFTDIPGPPLLTSSLKLVDTFVANATAEAELPTFKFLHLMLPHSPPGFDADCSYSEKNSKENTANFLEQARCSLKLTSGIFDALKRLGVFDKSLVIVTADHGMRLLFFSPNKGTAMFGGLPLLLIKPPAAAGQKPLAVSEVPVTLADIPATLSDALNLGAGFPGVSAFKVESGTPRDRRFFNYKWTHDNWESPYLPPLVEYVVTGHAWDRNSWRRQ